MARMGTKNYSGNIEVQQDNQHEKKGSRKAQPQLKQQMILEAGSPKTLRLFMT